MLGSRMKPWFAGMVVVWGAGHAGACAAQEPPAEAPAPAATATTAASAPPQVAVIVPTKKLSPLADSPRWDRLKEFDGVLTRTQFEKALAEVYGNGSNFPVPWQVDDSGVTISTSPAQAPVRVTFRAPTAEAPKITRYWRTAAELRRLEPGMPPLQGLHIALDPGHIGGSYARIEERWLSMNPGEEIMEGRLVLQVAQLLKPRLEALGARVSMVRDAETPLTKTTPQDLRDEALKVLTEAGIAQPEEAYSDPKNDARILTVQWQSEKLFYRVSEIRARAQKVNEELRPDLVLCLHLNAEPWGDPAQPAFVDGNHFHLLVNGCYSPDELQYEDIRYEMLRRLLSRVEQEELALSSPVAAAMAAATSLPPYLYNTPNARRVSGSPYVYARNLLANRLYECPVLYFEPFVMNHGETYRRLLLGHYLGRTLLDGRLVTSALEDYIRGVERGLVDYYTHARKGGA